MQGERLSLRGPSRAFVGEELGARTRPVPIGHVFDEPADLSCLAASLWTRVKIAVLDVTEEAADRSSHVEAGRGRIPGELDKTALAHRGSSMGAAGCSRKSARRSSADWVARAASARIRSSP